MEGQTVTVSSWGINAIADKITRRELKSDNLETNPPESQAVFI